MNTKLNLSQKTIDDFKRRREIIERTTNLYFDSVPIEDLKIGENLKLKALIIDNIVKSL